MEKGTIWKKHSYKGFGELLGLKSPPFPDLVLALDPKPLHLPRRAVPRVGSPGCLVFLEFHFLGNLEAGESMSYTQGILGWGQCQGLPPR